MGLFDFLKKTKSEAPLRLMAQSAEDVAPIAALLQDAILRGEDMQFDPKGRHFLLRMNRFCHERAGTPLRASCVVQIHSVLAIKSRGIDLKRPPQALSVLTLDALPKDDGAFELHIKFAGVQNPQLRLEIECLDIVLMDLAAPHRAKSKPHHNL